MVDSINVLNRLGFPSSQESTMVLSHHACVSHRGMFNVSLIEVSNLVSNVAPHNSSLGIDKGLTGATLVLAAISVQVGGDLHMWPSHKPLQRMHGRHHKTRVGGWSACEHS